MTNPFKTLTDHESRLKALEADKNYHERWELTERVEALTKILANANHVIDPSVREAAEAKLKTLIEQL